MKNPFRRKKLERIFFVFKYFFLHLLLTLHAFLLFRQFRPSIGIFSFSFRFRSSIRPNHLISSLFPTISRPWYSGYVGMHIHFISPAPFILPTAEDKHSEAFTSGYIANVYQLLLFLYLIPLLLRPCFQLRINGVLKELLAISIWFVSRSVSPSIKAFCCIRIKNHSFFI